MQKILIVEDDRALRLNLETYLEDEGFEVKCAENGEQAIASLTSFVPDLGIIDIRLPGIDGNDVILAMNKAHKNTKYIIHTGDLSYQLTPGVQQAGVKPEQILYKPLKEMRELKQLIQTVLQT